MGELLFSQHPPAIFGGKGPVQLKIISAQLSPIGAQLIKPILDPQLKMGGGRETYKITGNANNAIS